MKRLKVLMLFLNIFLIFFTYAAQAADFKPHQMAISVDPFLPGARGLTLKGEYEIAVQDNLSIIFPFRAIWIDSEQFSFLFKSGYAHLDPYNYIDNFLAYFNSKDVIKEVEATFGIGLKFYPNLKPLYNGFYIKPLLTLGYAWLDFQHTAMKVEILTGSTFYPKLIVPINDEDIRKEINSAVFIPEILIGYNINFFSHLLLSIEVGAKYRLFSRQEFVQYVPRLSGFEPSLNVMVGYMW